jgi:hypothetical protein
VPVDGGEVAEVGCVREPFGEDGGGVAVDVGDVGGGATEDRFYGEVEAAVPGAQRHHRRVHVWFLRRILAPPATSTVPAEMNPAP